MQPTLRVAKTTLHILRRIRLSCAAFAADLGRREIVVVTENAYPPLQFMDPKTGNAIGWEYDAIAEIGKRINATIAIQNTSWDAMIPAVFKGQFDVGMTGITVRRRWISRTVI